MTKALTDFLDLADEVNPGCFKSFEILKLEQIALVNFWGVGRAGLQLLLIRLRMPHGLNEPVPLTNLLPEVVLKSNFILLEIGAGPDLLKRRPLAGELRKQLLHELTELRSRRDAFEDFPEVLLSI